MTPPIGTGTRCSALVLHAGTKARQKHEAMGFHVDWGALAAQMD